MKKTSFRTRTLAPAVVLAVGALVANPAIAQSALGTPNAPTSETPEATAEPAITDETPSVLFPNHPSGEVDRKRGETISIKVGYENVTTGDPITVVVNGDILTHGEGYQSIQKTDRKTGAFWLQLDGGFLDNTSSGADATRDIVQVRVGETRNAINVNEIAEDPADITPTVNMDYPLQAQDVADKGIDVRVKTAPNAMVDVSRIDVSFAGGYTLQPTGDWNGTADANGDYTFTLSPDTKITSSFNPDRNTTIGQLADGDAITVQIQSNGKGTSFTTVVEGTVEQPDDKPTEEPTDEPTEDPTGEPTEDPTDEPTDGEDGEDDDQSSESSLSIEPDRIKASDFIDADRGVTLTVTGLEPGDDVEFEVAPASGQYVDPAAIPETANDDGVASTVVYGTSTVDPNSYIGDFDVAVSGVDDSFAGAGAETSSAAAGSKLDDLGGTFTVLSDDSAGGGDGGSDDKDGGNQLPRTGGEFGGLAVGGALLAVGAAAVVLTRRRLNRD